eukprot:g9504.t1
MLKRNQSIPLRLPAKLGPAPVIQGGALHMGYFGSAAALMFKGLQHGEGGNLMLPTSFDICQATKQDILQLLGTYRDDPIRIARAWEQKSNPLPKARPSLKSLQNYLQAESALQVPRPPGNGARPPVQRPTPHLQGLQEISLRSSLRAEEERGYPAAANGGVSRWEGHGSLASIEGTSSPTWPSLPSSSASTRTPSPGLAQGAAQGRRWSGQMQGQVAPPVRWQWQPSDRERRLRERGEGAGHLKGRRANLAKIREEQWKKFEQRRHRLKPPELFDETSNRHKKYDEFVASPDRELIEVTRRLADGHPAWQGFGQEEVEGGEEFAVPLAEYLARRPSIARGHGQFVLRWKLLLHFLLLLASSGPAATPNLMERCQVILNLHKGHSALESLPTPALLQQATMNFDLMNLTESNHLPRSVLKHRAFCPSVELQDWRPGWPLIQTP